MSTTSAAGPSVASPAIAGPPAPPFLTYAVYLLSTGQIVGQTTCAPGSATAAGGTLGEVAGTLDPSTTYIDTTQTPPAAVARPACLASLDTTSIPADGATPANFAAIPAGSVFAVDDQPPITVDDGAVAFCASVAGTYAVTIAPPFPALVGTFSVVAT